MHVQPLVLYRYHARPRVDCRLCLTGAQDFNKKFDEAMAINAELISVSVPAAAKEDDKAAADELASAVEKVEVKE